MKRNNSVLIMMATYNGTEYLREQLESIIRQTYKNWDLLIRDDGSNDGTVDLLKQYTDGDHIRLLINDSSEHGSATNFRQLVIGGGQYNYYMYADQDDIWDEDKVEKMLATAQKYEDGEHPVVVYANMRLIDGSGNVTNENLNLVNNMEMRHPMVDCFFSHRVFGCNMMFNNVLFNKLQNLMCDPLYHSMGHDNFTVKVAAAYDGIFEFLEEPLMSYRRHGNNVTSKQQYKITPRRIISRLSKIDDLAKDLSYLYWCSLQTCRILLKQDDLPCREKIESVMVAIEKGGFNAVCAWIKNKVSCGNKVRSISHFSILTLGMYKKYLSSHEM